MTPRNFTRAQSMLSSTPSAFVRRMYPLVLFCLIAAPLAAAAQTRTEILVGLALSETGRFADASRRLRAATERTIADLNAAGGVLGKHLRLVVSDDTCTEAGATATAQIFLSQGVHLVVGHPCERSALSAAAVYAQEGILYLATETRHSTLTDRYAGSTILRLAGRDDRQGEAAGTWLADTTTSGRTAIIKDRSAYARTIAKSAADVLEERYRPAPHVFTIHAAEKTYESVVAKLKEAGIDALFFAGYPTEAIIILNAMRRLDLKAKFLGSDSLLTPEFAAHAVARHADVRVLARPRAVAAANLNTIVADNPHTRPAPLPVHDVKEAPIAAAVWLWADAVRAAGTDEPAAVRDELSGRTFTLPPFGSVTFDAKGDARIPSFVPAASDGTVWTAED